MKRNGSAERETPVIEQIKGSRGSWWRTSQSRVEGGLKVDIVASLVLQNDIPVYS